MTIQVCVDRAGRGVLVDDYGNHVFALASEVAITSVDASDPDVVRQITERAERFTHTCFLVTQYGGFVDVPAALNRLIPGMRVKKTVLFTTGAEAIENAIKIARAATGAPAGLAL